MKQLAVIILNWNGRRLLEQFLPAAARYTISDHADRIVADNGSSDDSVEWVRREYPDVKILRLDRNYGFAAGYNRAIRETHYPYTILLNSDVEVTEDWWLPLLELTERQADCSTASDSPIVAGASSTASRMTAGNMTASRRRSPGPRGLL